MDGAAGAGRLTKLLATFSFYGVPWLALSYSYNSPDSGTFLPIPDVHVIGFQIVYGPVEMARPLLPIMPPASELVGAR